jgi:hypothetical protein
MRVSTSHSKEQNFLQFKLMLTQFQEKRISKILETSDYTTIDHACTRGAKDHVVWKRKKHNGGYHNRHCEGTKKEKAVVGSGLARPTTRLKP